MTLFWMTGLHRKLDAPKTLLASISLAMLWVMYIVVNIIPLLVGRGDSAGALMFVIGMFLMPVLFVFMVVAGLAAAKELKTMAQYKSVLSA